MNADEVIHRLKEAVREVVREELAAALPKKRGPARQPVVIAQDGGWSIPRAILEQWAAAYPMLSIEQEIGRAWAWATSNPSKAPRKALARFLNAWLARAAKSEQKRPEAACAHCSGSLAAGSTSSHVGLICNPCWDGYMSGAWR